MKRTLLKIVAGLFLIALTLAALVFFLNRRGEDALAPAEPPSAKADAATIARGAYLARAGNCVTCHTARGGAEYAGGRGIETPFGTVYAPNLTPDASTGLGDWTEPEFWRALHNGRSRDGHLLYPAFPYTSFTQIRREDATALYAFLRSLPAVQQANRPHELRFPYKHQASLAVWRALFFRPGTFEPTPQLAADWNRGAYLVRGLGHCSACHAERNGMGASEDELRLAGGLIPMQNWLAPALTLTDATRPDFVALLKTGVSARGAAMGPMAEVVHNSTSWLTEPDLNAMAVYLRSLPAAELRSGKKSRPDPARIDLGKRIYADRCADCHGERGAGEAGLFPPLAGNPSVLLAEPHNVIQAILHGGFAPATPGNPRPAGMPPFKQTLDEAEIAAVATFIRQAWGNSAPSVTALEVLRLR